MLNKETLTAGIQSAATILLRLGMQYPEAAARLRYGSEQAEEIAIETAEGLWLYALDATDALKRDLLNAYPPRRGTAQPDKWHTDGISAEDAFLLLSHAATYIYEHPQQHLTLSMDAAAISLTKKETAAAFSVMLTPHTAHTHLAASDATPENAFSYLEHSPYHYA